MTRTDASDLLIRVSVLEELVIHITRSLIAETANPNEVLHSVVSELRGRFEGGADGTAQDDIFLTAALKRIDYIEEQLASVVGKVH